MRGRKGAAYAMEKDILVDGYNVIKNHLMFQSLVSKNFASARDLLIRQLKNRYRHTGHRVIVVFDGDGTYEQVDHDEYIRIIFSRRGETADSVIVRLTAEACQAGRTVHMYSNDQEVCSSVEKQGGNTRTTVQLTRQLQAAPQDVAHRSLHRQKMRHLYGIDPWCKYKDDDVAWEREHASPRRKKKSSRRSR